MYCTRCGSEVATLLTIPDRAGGGKCCRRCLDWPGRWFDMLHGIDDRVPGERTNGIEIEINIPPSAALDALALNCNLHRDGSLRGDYPVEIVSPVLSESTVGNWLDEVSGVIKKGVIYRRAGLHTWHGLNGWWAANNLLRMCSGWQSARLITWLVAPSRNPGGYDQSGRPMQIPRIPRFESKKAMIHYLYGPNPTGGMLHGRRINDRGNRVPGASINRYWWVNIHPLWAKDAIEIRLHQATKNVEKILMWVRMWNQICAAAENGCVPWHKAVSADVYKYYVGRAWALAGVTERDILNASKEAFGRGKKDPLYRLPPKPQKKSISLRIGRKTIHLGKHPGLFGDARVRMYYRKKVFCFSVWAADFPDAVRILERCCPIRGDIRPTKRRNINGVQYTLYRMRAFVNDVSRNLLGWTAAWNRVRLFRYERPGKCKHQLCSRVGIMLNDEIDAENERIMAEANIRDAAIRNMLGAAREAAGAQWTDLGGEPPRPRRLEVNPPEAFYGVVPNPLAVPPVHNPFTGGLVEADPRDNDLEDLVFNIDEDDLEEQDEG